MEEKNSKGEGWATIFRVLLYSLSFWVISGTTAKLGEKAKEGAGGG